MPAILRTQGRPLRVILYARVSLDQRKEGRSVAQQLKQGREVAAEQGWQVVAEYSDNDVSASQYSRKVREDWPKVEEDVTAGRADLLWLWEISRGTRDLVVWAHLARACEAHRMYIALDEDLWDTTNPDHMKYLNGLMVDAAHESAKTKKRTARDFAARAEEGGPHGRPGYGYHYVYHPKTGALARKEPNPETAPVVKEIYRRLDSGDGPLVIAKDLNARGIPNASGYRAGDPMPGGKASRGWMPTTVTQLARSPQNMGRRVHKGRIIREGGWDALVEEPRWWRVQARLDSSRERNPRPNRDGGAKYLLSGIATCGAEVEGQVCGGWMLAKQSSRKRARQGRQPLQVYYNCSGKWLGDGRQHTARLVERLDAHVEELLFTRFADPDVVEAFRAPAVRVEEAEARVAALEAEKVQIEAQVRDGSQPRWLLAADAQRVERELAAARAAVRPARGGLFAEELATDPQAVWTAWSVEQRRRALRALCEEVRVVPVGRGRRQVSPQESVRITWAGVET